MDKGEKLTIAGDVAILIIIAFFLSAGLVSSSSVISGIVYVILGGFLTLSLWGFRHRILGPSQAPKKLPGLPGRTRFKQLLRLKPIAQKKGEVIADETKVIRSSEYEYYPVTMTRKDRCLEL